jgi:hypothetical protein
MPSSWREADDAQSYKYKNYYGKKVWTVNAADVEWVECEHVNKSCFITQLESQKKIEMSFGSTTKR